MTMVVMVPLMLRRELSRGTFEVEYRSLEWHQESQGLMQLQTKNLVVGTR